MLWLFDLAQRADARVQFAKGYQWGLWHTIAHTVLVWAAILWLNFTVDRVRPTLDIAAAVLIGAEYLEMEIFGKLRAAREGPGEGTAVNV
jgi:hypothetical protein